MLTIHVEDGSGRSWTGNTPLTIGRGAGCELHLDDDALSRKHLVIRREGRDYIAEDQKTTNGTFLYGTDQKIESAILRSGDALLVGRTRLRVEIGPDEGETAEGLIRFTILEPPEAAGVFSTQHENIVIGRHPSSDVVIKEPTVSRRHAMVVRTSAGFVINDQNSLNAVFVGTPPEQVSAAILFDGEEIRLGRARLRVEIPGDLGKAPEPPQIDSSAAGLPLEVPRPAVAALQLRLAHTPLFKGFTEDDWKIFLAAYEREQQMRVERFAPEQTVCEAGKYDLSFCVVLKGTVDALDPVKSGEKVASYSRGDFFGLIEAKRALPRATSIVATTEAYVLFVPRHQIRYIEHNAPARQLLAARYKEQTWRVMAAQLDLFQGMQSSLLADLIERSEILFYDKAGIVIIKQGAAADSFYVVRDGFVKVVQTREDGTDRVIAYLRPGEFFGEMALVGDATREASVLTAGKAELLKIDRATMQEVCAQHPDVEQRARQVAEHRREANKHITRQLSNQLEKWGQGYIQADALLVMDLDLCVKCDLCVTACETLHGESRLIRRGMQLGKYLVPGACRHCDDPMCMFACPTGAIDRRREGEIFVKYDLCVGCGACAIACPYDNIAMIETGKFDAAQARKQATIPDREFFRPHPVVRQPASEISWLQRLGLRQIPEVPPESEPEPDPAHPIPPRYPIKCDLCDGLPYMGCVHACPTGAAIRVDPRTILKETGAVSVGSRVDKATSV
jgi:CRP-like cAMP-binding protein/Fe-S-cluster-containing hydrogenase component 2/pSer/pThr/pTyr-binding forkhead associated (FHA) protein